MSMSSFPSLVGGTVIREDLIPSVLFIVLYASILPLAVWRIVDKTSRTTLLINFILGMIDRIVMLSLRVVQSRNEEKAASHGLTAYEQLSLGMGFIGIANGLTSILQAVLVDTTNPPGSSDESSGVRGPDDPRARQMYRSLFGFLNLAFFASVVPGTIVGTDFARVINHPENTGRFMRLRYASSGVALFLTAAMAIIALVALRKIPRLNRSAVFILVTVCTLLSTVAIYRLVVMQYTIDSVLSRGPGSLSSPAAKALFYVFHMAPEWIATAILFGCNIRRIFATGPFGDWRGADPKDKKKKEEEKKGNDEEGDSSTPDSLPERC